MYKRSALIFFLFALALPAGATTVIPPSDLGNLAKISASVTFAQAVESWVEEGETIPQTVTRFHLLEAVAGAKTGAVFEVREPGGSLGTVGAVVAGAPAFEPGHRYLLFLDRTADGRWHSKMMAYGLLEEVPGTDLLRPLAAAGAIELAQVQGGEKAEPPGLYRQEALLDHLREVVNGTSVWDRQLVAAAEPDPRAQTQFEKLHDKPTACAFLTHSGDNLPFRWFGYETGGQNAVVFATTPGQTGIADGGVSAVQQAMAAWTNHSDSVIRFSYGGTQPRSVSCSGNFDLQQGAVLFNDPCSDIANLVGCTGILAFGGAFFDLATQSYDGEPWHRATSAFVVVNNDAQCIGDLNFKETLTHELGHAQGFNHHTPPNPRDATMSAALKRDGRGASIAVTDKVCASYAYHTFLDVPYDYWAWRFIEAIENAGVSAVGCLSGNYCPGNTITRDQMAVFLLKAKEGGSYTPPPCTTPRFADVPCSSTFAPWINELVARGVTAGCGGNNYCPGTAVTRSQMAVFLLATKEGSGYRPPACTSPRFTDMPCSSSFAPWVNELVARGVTAGCGGSSYCPNDVVNRAQMAVFLATAFGLPVPP
jgi:hypothetical protein